MQHPASGRNRRSHAPQGIAISKPINPGKLLGELKTHLGVTGTIEKNGTESSLVVTAQPAGVTATQIQSVINQHSPTPAPHPLMTKLATWPHMTPQEKDSFVQQVLTQLLAARSN